jgi:hypothetical protein
MLRRIGRRLGMQWLLTILVVALAVCVGNDKLSANETLAMKFYGRGVHAYHDGRYSEALRYLDRATTYETRDPRIYYFRGLAKKRLGYYAEADLQMAAQLEVALGRRDVGRALARVQGSDRLTVEQYRAEARKLPTEVVQSLVPLPARPPVIVRSEPRIRPAIPVQRVVALEQLGTDDTDPFRDGTLELLGQGKPVAPQSASGDALTRSNPGRPASANQNVAADDAFADEPFGSGVASDGTDADDRGADLFGEDGDFGAETAEFAAPRSGGAGRAAEVSGEEKPSALGAVFRAFTRGLTPNAPRGGQQMIDGLRGRVTGEAAGEQAADELGDPFQDDPNFGAGPDGADGMDNASDDDAFGDGANDPFAADDPFADDEGANQADASEDGETDDPFGFE